MKKLPNLYEVCRQAACQAINDHGIIGVREMLEQDQSFLLAEYRNGRADELDDDYFICIVAESIYHLPYWHIKSGKEYRLLHIAKNEADQTEIAVYKDDKGQIWTRPLVEFNEKFKPFRRADG